MILYPIILVSLGLTEAQTAFVLGASIHDVAQVVGAGLSVSEETARLAVLVKMVRISLLPLVLILLILGYAAAGQKGAGQRIPIPAFLIAFFLFAVLANIGAVGEPIVQIATTVSRWLLVISIAALGARTSLRNMATIGRAKINHVAGLTLVLFVTASIVSSYVISG